MKDFKLIVISIGFALVFTGLLLLIGDYVGTKLENHERRIAELEAEARPLIVVDKWAHVYLNAEEVPPPEEEEAETK